MFKVINNLKTVEKSFLTIQNVLNSQIRTTFILKRTTPPFLHKKGSPPRKFRSRHYIYELVEDTSVKKKENINVILTSFVQGLGNVGEKVSIKPNYAYDRLLLPGLAVYDTPENEQEYSNADQNMNKETYSSPNVLHIKAKLSRMILSIIMNKDVPWKLEPWHVKASFRKMGMVVPESGIKIPSKTITGPDINLENKIFYVTVTINKTEKVNVRCKIHHWSTNIVDRLPYVEDFWKKPIELLFPEDAEVIKEIETDIEKYRLKNL